MRAVLTPAQQPALQRFRAYEKQQHKGHNEKDEPHGQRRIIGALGKLQQIAKTTGGSDKLANDGSRKRKTNGNLETGEDPRRYRGYINLSEQNHAPAAERADSVYQQLVYILYAAVDGEVEFRG